MMKKGEPKTLTYLSLTAVVLFLAWMAFAVVHNHMPVKETFWALTPPIIAIALALITKEVYSSLFLGILTGAFLNAGFDLVGTLNQVFQEGMLTVLSDKWNVGILIFLIILGVGSANAEAVRNGRVRTSLLQLLVKAREAASLMGRERNQRLA